MGESSAGGRAVLVTGSTKGIGRAIAEAFVRRGDRVVVSGRDRQEAERVAEGLSAIGPGGAVGIPCDLMEADRCRALVAEAAEKLGGLDVLVNNAGVGRFAPVDELTEADWDRQIRTNLDAVFHCSKAAVPHLRARGGGWIVQIASLAARHPFSGGAGYNASKFGLLGLSEAMMLDLRSEGIRVSCVLPGSVRTDFFGHPPGPEDAWKLAPEDVARAVLELLNYPDHALPSRVELRPAAPPRR